VLNVFHTNSINEDTLCSDNSVSLDEINEEALNKVKWHDLPTEQLHEAAVQLHSVIFARLELGALSHFYDRIWL
jgi:hypothetical protein